MVYHIIKFIFLKMEDWMLYINALGSLIKITNEIKLLPSLCKYESNLITGNLCLILIYLI